MSRSTGSWAHASMTNCVPFFSRFDGAWTTSGRGLSDGRPRAELAQVEPRRDHVSLGHPARRVVGADDLRVGALAECERFARLAADVRSEIVEDALLPQRAQERELDRLRDQRQAEVEVEDVGLRGEAGEGGELLCELHRQRPAPVERPVGLVVQLPALEDDEPRVDPLAPQRLDVLPRDPRDVHGAVRHPQPLWKVRHAFVTSFGVPRSGSPPAFAAPRRPSFGEGTGLAATCRKGLTGRTRAGRSSGARFGPGGCATRTTGARRPRARRARASRRDREGSGPPGRRSSRSAG